MRRPANCEKREIFWWSGTGSRSAKHQHDISEVEVMRAVQTSEHTQRADRTLMNSTYKLVVNLLAHTPDFLDKNMFSVWHGVWSLAKSKANPTSVGRGPLVDKLKH